MRSASRSRTTSQCFAASLVSSATIRSAASSGDAPHVSDVTPASASMRATCGTYFSRTGAYWSSR
ncbi:Uncharacterised protein [Mycobacteroides abscessus]|nr:Uncharacterised protein [Mycobacteroides abscessus]